MSKPAPSPARINLLSLCTSAVDNPNTRPGHRYYYQFTSADTTLKLVSTVVPWIAEVAGELAEALSQLALPTMYSIQSYNMDISGMHG